MPKQIGIGIPKDPLETQHYFVQVAETQALDGCHLPVWQGWDELHGVGHSLSVGSCALFEHP
jgi:hypothetical protein